MRDNSSLIQAISMELEEKKIIIKDREEVDWTVLTDWLPVGRKEEDQSRIMFKLQMWDTSSAFHGVRVRARSGLKEVQLMHSVWDLHKLKCPQSNKWS